MLRLFLFRLLRHFFLHRLGQFLGQFWAAGRGRSLPRRDVLVKANGLHGRPQALEVGAYIVTLGHAARAMTEEPIA